MMSQLCVPLNYSIVLKLYNYYLLLNLLCTGTLKKTFFYRLIFLIFCILVEMLKTYISFEEDMKKFLIFIYLKGVWCTIHSDFVDYRYLNQ